ncbi:antirestriction protein ArdA [Pseudahrensia aquimaris]|uniref:Antirestriction protein ArdA n=1 Tax=Pseudahrensia aquimaris TaxID=744461 RepID=A0ABW3FGG2_9HYPH
MTRLYAQPYDISAVGFYFDSAEDYKTKADKCRNNYGDPVEEFEIQFIDGERIDCAFADAFQLNQVNLVRFFDLVDEWEDHEKIRFIIANGECGYRFNPDTDDIETLEVDIYEVDTLKQLAEQFVDEGLFGEVPKAFESYIDFDAIANDLSVDYAMTDIAGDRLAYRCG